MQQGYQLGAGRIVIFHHSPKEADVLPVDIVSIVMQELDLVYARGLSPDKSFFLFF